MDEELRPFWSRFLRFNWRFGLLLILLVCIPRFLLVLNANKTGSYGWIGLIMLLSAIVPFIFLSRYGRQQIGIKKPHNIHWIFVALPAGILVSLLLYVLGDWFYGNSFENWYVYIGKSYNIPEVITRNDKLLLFTIMAITGMTFSPIGEELFFRGIVHTSFAKSLGDKKASVIDSTAFAFTHISHFGLVFIHHQWDIYIIPAAIWVLSMFLVSILFFFVKTRSDSLWGAVICHAGFNLGMIYSIFYLL